MYCHYCRRRRTLPRRCLPAPAEWSAGQRWQAACGSANRLNQGAREPALLMRCTTSIETPQSPRHGPAGPPLFPSGRLSRFPMVQSTESGPVTHLCDEVPEIRQVLFSITRLSTPVRRGHRVDSAMTPDNNRSEGLARVWPLPTRCRAAYVTPPGRLARYLVIRAALSFHKYKSLRIFSNADS
jgi:hypothetical protein